MDLTPKERLVLFGVLRGREALQALDYLGVGIPRERLGAYRMHISNAQAGLVPLDLAAWIGHQPTASESVMYSRTYARLEARGLVERHRLGGTAKTSHPRLTEAGEALAKELQAK